MCLLRPGQPDAQCGHKECNSFYMLNKQSCLYNFNTSKASNDSNSQSSENTSNQPQISPFSFSRSSAFTSKISPINMKKLLPGKSDASTDEESEAGANSKKVKTEENSSNVQASAIPLNAFIQQNMPLNALNLNTQTGPTTYPTALPITKNLTPDAISLQNLLNTPQGLLSLAQNPQVNLLGNTLPSTTPPNVGIQYKYAPISMQNFSQTAFPVSLEASTQQTNRSSEAQSSANLLEESMKETFSNSFKVLSQQSMMLNDLAEKTGLVQDTLACLIKEISSLKKSVLGPNKDASVTPHAQRSTPSQPINTTNETITSEELLGYLYGQKSDYEYKIVFKESLELPLYKERNFGFIAQLVDKEGNIVENSNKIPLTMSIYTCENPPKFIDINTAGNKIFKGFTEIDLVKGVAVFDKIQIKEVTSHFRNGWVFFVVHPKTVGKHSNTVFDDRNGENVDAEKIRPLILDRVVVKAKKMKEKEDGSESKMPGEL